MVPTERSVRSRLKAWKGVAMLARSAFSVHLESGGISLAEAMEDVRAWLDRHRIEPIEFTLVATSRKVIAFDIRFRKEREAVLFTKHFV